MDFAAPGCFLGFLALSGASARSFKGCESMPTAGSSLGDFSGFWQGHSARGVLRISPVLGRGTGVCLSGFGQPLNPDSGEEPSGSGQNSLETSRRNWDYKGDLPASNVG